MAAPIDDRVDILSQYQALIGQISTMIEEAGQPDLAANLNQCENDKTQIALRALTDRLNENFAEVVASVYSDTKECELQVALITEALPDNYQILVDNVRVTVPRILVGVDSPNAVMDHLRDEINFFASSNSNLQQEYTGAEADGGMSAFDAAATGLAAYEMYEEFAGDEGGDE